GDEGLPADGAGRRAGQVDALVVHAEALGRVGVVPDGDASGTADDGGPDLGRAEPVDVDVGDATAGQGQGEVADTGVAHADGVGPLGADRLGQLALGQQEVEDRQVVGGQVPEDVDVRLDEAEVDADRVEVLQVAQGAVVDKLAELTHRRGVAVGVVAHQHQALTVGGRDQLLALGHRGRERLLDQDVPAGLQAGSDAPPVGSGRGGHPA